MSLTNRNIESLTGKENKAPNLLNRISFSIQNRIEFAGFIGTAESTIFNLETRT